ncbi:aminotransferase class I/II-fold pyridoxal phosphate-dependent enzyme [candidate division WOR-3 bacterium]|nr:aminotransferase class I/II-fold pyridoxal phosphate-dependent enzyme [candidate division WOR-3 bacterium]
MNKNLDIKTICVHASSPETAPGPVVCPIYATSTFRFKDFEQGADLFAGKTTGYIYSRMLNPTVELLEDCLARLEQGKKSLATASGMAAIQTLIGGLLTSGDHIICSESVYGPTATLIQNYFSRFGIKSTFVDSSDLNAVAQAFRPETRLVFIETPGNPTLVVSDIAAIADICHKKDALLAVDNTFASPVLQQPLKLGADIVVHSMTKFLNGHADVVGGAIVVKDEKHYDLLRKTLNHFGGVLAPFEAFLVLRGIKTLALRMARHCENGQRVAEFLEKHPKVEWIRFPGLASHPQYNIARKQMSGPGGLISFELKGGFEAARRLLNATKLFLLAVSLGGVESLIQHPASMTHASMPAEIRKQAGITDGLIRLSIGIEDAQDLINDLKQALDQV